MQVDFPEATTFSILCLKSKLLQTQPHMCCCPSSAAKTSKQAHQASLSLAVPKEETVLAHTCTSAPITYTFGFL